MPSTGTRDAVNVGLLSTIQDPLLPHFLFYALQYGVTGLAVICDRKQLSERDQRIIAQRTDGALRSLEGQAADVYRFGRHRVPFYFVDSHNGEDTIDLIAELGLQYLLNAGTPRRISSRVLSSVPAGIINVHPGVLPQYRGCSCVEWAILNDDPVGNTAHFMDEGYDTGPIIASETYQFAPFCTYTALRTTVYLKGCELAARVLRQLQDGTLTAAGAVAQPPEAGRYWDPLPDTRLVEVEAKLAGNHYQFQLREPV